MSNDTIVWKDIPGYEGLYQVSNTGLVRSLRARGKHPVNYVLKPDISKGYLRVTLAVKGIKERIFIHRLVMLVFAGLRPDGLVVNHKNGNRLDNCRGNLEYCTQKENIHHAMNVLKTRITGAEHGCAKLDDEKVRFIIHTYTSGELTGVQLARLYGVSAALISLVVRRKIWKHVG